MTALVLGLLLFQAGSTPATQTTTQPPEKPVEQCVIAGVVVKGPSGEP